jgi:hypothetical protein
MEELVGMEIGGMESALNKMNVVVNMVIVVLLLNIVVDPPLLLLLLLHKHPIGGIPVKVVVHDILTCTHPHGTVNHYHLLINNNNNNYDRHQMIIPEQHHQHNRQVQVPD